MLTLLELEAGLVHKMKDSDSQVALTDPADPKRQLSDASFKNCPPMTVTVVPPESGAAVGRIPSIRKGNSY